ncbi:MAG: hypothetical protein Q3972_05955 [Corynebacterium sp.]|nr:hypothetical protein [Corynebacterium sp.]
MKFTTARKIAVSGAFAFAALTGAATAAHADEVAAAVTVVNPVDEARAEALATLDSLDNLPTYKVLNAERSLKEASTVDQINTIIYNTKMLDTRIAINSHADADNA